VQLERFPQICESLFLSSALAGNINFKALGNEPFPLAPDGGRKRTRHETILPQSAARAFSGINPGVAAGARTPR